MKIVIGCYRRKEIGPRGGMKLVHGVEQDGKMVSEHGTSRSDAQMAFIALEKKLKAEGHQLETVCRNWYGRF